MEGRTSTDDDPHSGRLLSATSPDVVRRVAQLLDEDRRVTCEEVANSFNISPDSAHRILRENLEKRKIAAKWVPHILTDQKVARMTISAAHLYRFRQEGNRFRSRSSSILAGPFTVRLRLASSCQGESSWREI